MPTGATGSGERGGTTAAGDAPTDTEALIVHILARYHALHRREIAQLTSLARKVEALHAGHRSVPRGHADLLTRFGCGMEAHTQKEEEGLFPTILAGGGGLAMAIEIMHDDHDDDGARLEEIAALTADLTMPDDVGESWSALYAGLRVFAADLREHIRLENDGLFPRFGALARRRPVPCRSAWSRSPTAPSAASTRTRARPASRWRSPASLRRPGARCGAWCRTSGPT